MGPADRQQRPERGLPCLGRMATIWVMAQRHPPLTVECGDEEADRPRRFPGPAFAALDLGTNNCRLLVAAPSGGGFRVLDSFSRIVRLGEGLHHTGRLSQTAMDRAIAALHACSARLSRRPVRRLRAIATEACRRAANGAEFLSRVYAETGLRIDVISTREEAELALESCAPLLLGKAAGRSSSISAAARPRSPGCVCPSAAGRS